MSDGMLVYVDVGVSVSVRISVSVCVGVSVVGSVRSPECSVFLLNYYI